MESNEPACRRVPVACFKRFGRARGLLSLNQSGVLWACLSSAPEERFNKA
ncbi:hypothetical protein M2222_003845 [Bradyrhizobium elkanii]|nr:hypothetical protein [Bradyrhizobium elkanii]MCS3561523.1 hypothetical protein [Bradyrhizobium elkanii]MCW2148635.1 hypothetical protein [Bradyrhizobium elkanii]MCW2352278.1 hypothetical protein [Bradyrhizobium elkanii]MCW2372364.1 hypothetical protein [Bradyrhizobium elkanii]